MFLVFRLKKIAGDLREPEYYLFSVGVSLLISLALIINSYGVSGITPIKGIAVPLLSYGGSQIVANSVAIGMVLMLSKKRQKWKYLTKNQTVTKNSEEQI
jgi:cell division protein FtsW